jgi:AAA family ATP:ADP antiporter
MMGIAYGVIFFIMGLLLLHPTIGLSNTEADPTRILGWISYCAIESFGSMVVQCYWALVNASVDTDFAKKYFGVIIAGAQVGSILGPTIATQANAIGVPTLYLGGAGIMFIMVGAMYFYIQQFGILENEEQSEEPSSSSSSSKNVETGVMEGFYLFYEHDYVKGIFAISSFSMVQITVIDYMMKVLAMERYSHMYPDNPQAMLRGFASFMGYFGQVYFSIIRKSI